MKKRIQVRGFIIGFLVAAMLFSGVNVMAAATWRKIDVAFDNYKIVIDGKEFTAKDNKGNVIETYSYNGWIYSPFEHIAKALGKPVVWDGNAKTMYIGKMDGKLKYPTVRLKDMKDNIGSRGWKQTDKNKDNYGNVYTETFYISGSINNEAGVEYLLNMKYSAFKGTFYVPAGTSGGEHSFRVEADGNIIYTSPKLDKTSAPVNFNVDISGCNHIKIINTRGSADSYYEVYIADAGFYQ